MTSFLVFLAVLGQPDPQAIQLETPVEELDKEYRAIVEDTYATLVAAGGVVDSATVKSRLDKHDEYFQRLASYALAKRADPNVVNASAGWVINGKGIARQVFAERNAGIRPAAPRFVSLDDVRLKLERESVLIHIQRFKDSFGTPPGVRYAAWVITPTASGIDQAVVDLGAEAEMTGLVGNFVTARNATEDYDTTPNNFRDFEDGELIEDWHSTLGEIRKQTIDRIPEAARNQEWLILSPAADLWHVPFAALPVGTVMQGDVEHTEYLIEKHRVSYVIAGRDILHYGQPSPRSRSDALIYGDPQFGEAPGGSTTSRSAWSIDSSSALALLTVGLGPEVLSNGLFHRRRHRSARCQGCPPGLVPPRTAGNGSTKTNDSTDQGKNQSGLLGGCGDNFGRSAESGQLARTIGKELGLDIARTRTHLRTGQDATEESFRALTTAEGFSTLVFCTHGFACPPRPTGNQLLFCGLALKDANLHRTEAERITESDGILRGADVVGHKLNGTDLVILAACQTSLEGQSGARGINSTKSGVIAGESVSSMRHAFGLAGARSVIATSWKVDIVPTTHLLTGADNTADPPRKIDGFFELLKTGEKEKALQSAQVNMIKDLRAAKKRAHPFLWAAFSLTGDWGARPAGGGGAWNRLDHFRLWTTSDHARQVEARFLGREGDMIRFELSDGRMIATHLGYLAAEDQRLINGPVPHVASSRALNR